MGLVVYRGTPSPEPERAVLRTGCSHVAEKKVLDRDERAAELGCGVSTASTAPRGSVPALRVGGARGSQCSGRAASPASASLRAVSAWWRRLRLRLAHWTARGSAPCPGERRPPAVSLVRTPLALRWTESGEPRRAGGGFCPSCPAVLRVCLRVCRVREVGGAFPRSSWAVSHRGL